MDLRRLARDFLDRAHEDVRDDRDAEKAGNVYFISETCLSFSYKNMYKYVDVLVQTKYRSQLTCELFTMSKGEMSKLSIFDFHFI